MTTDREHAAIRIRYEVASGFWTADEIAETVLETCFGLAEVSDADADWVGIEIRRAFRLQHEAELTWPPVTDWDKLDSVFVALDQTGIIALHNAGTTLSDGISDVTEVYHARGAQSSGVVGYCFYHSQDIDRAIDGGALMLAFGDISGDPAKGVEVGRRVTQELEKSGFRTVWNGTVGQRIAIEGLCWQKRGAG